MGKEKPESEDRLGKNVKNGIGNDLSINTDFSRAIGNTPDDWVDSPENEGEASNSLEESSSLAVLGQSHGTSVISQLVDDNKVSQAAKCIVTPLGSLIASKGSEKTGQNHDKIGHHSNEDVGTAESSKESKIQEKEWGGNTPVDVTSPIDLSVDVLGDVRNVLVDYLDLDVIPGDSVTDSHGEVGDGGEGGDESCKDVEETFLLCWISINPFKMKLSCLPLGHGMP
jgi:hypothetical protein